MIEFVFHKGRRIYTLLFTDLVPLSRVLPDSLSFLTPSSFEDEKNNPPAIMSFKEFFKFFELTCLSYLWLSLNATPSPRENLSPPNFCPCPNYAHSSGLRVKVTSSGLHVYFLLGVLSSIRVSSFSSLFTCLSLYSALVRLEVLPFLVTLVSLAPSSVSN